MVKATRTTIQLNGQSYDAMTGQRLSGHQPGNIDGVVRQSSIAKKPLDVSVQRSNNHTAYQLNKKPKPTQTLMRKAVKKPTKISPIASRLSVAKSSALQTSTMVGSVNPSLANRSSLIKLSQHISRFGATTKQASQPAQPSLKQLITPAVTIPAANKYSSINSFNKALEAANSHQQPPLTNKQLKALHVKKMFKGRAIAYSLVSLAAIVVIGYAIYQNIPNVMVKVASVRAGFAANLPSYRPSGFSLSAVGYQPGMVAFNFLSNVDNRKFTITERSSNWDSSTLVSSVVVPTEGTNYKKIMVDGQSIYIYGTDQAAWVSNNIWYQVKGNGSLSTNQIIQMATTL